MLRATAFFVVWLALTDGLPGDMPVGVIAAAIATWVSLKLLPPTPARPSPLGLLALAGRFLCASLTAGVDVARRALDPRLPIKPGLITYRTGLPPGPARDAFRALMCLQPGSLPVESEEEDGFLIHCLDTDMPAAKVFAREEVLFAKALGIEARNG
ncbi:MAG TPA: Na+/H+ antiporter subunit E [Tardiphaga sp.]